MNSAVETKHRGERGEQTYHEGCSHAVPATSIYKLGKDNLCIRARRQNPEGDDDGKETANVDNEHQTFDHGQSLCEMGIEDNGQEDHGNNEQCSVPPLGIVGLGVEQDDQSLCNGPGNEGDGHNGGLPAGKGEPSSEEAEVSLAESG